MEVGFPVAHGMFFDNRSGASRQFFCTIPTLQPDHWGALAPVVTRILGRKQLNGVNFVKGNSSSEREGVQCRSRGVYKCCMVMGCGKGASSRPVSSGASAVLTFSKSFRCRRIIPFASLDFLVCPLHYAELAFRRYLLSPYRSGFFHVPGTESDYSLRVSECSARRRFRAAVRSVLWDGCSLSG